jgi:hypothetical protein
MIENARRRGYREAELSWVADDNVKSLGTIGNALGVRPTKSWRIYAREL